MKSTEHWREYFDDKFEESDPWSYATSEYEQTKYVRQIQVADNHVEQPDKILEIGCSEGVHSEMLLDEFPSAELLGISLSKHEIERAQERVDTERATFVTADATKYLRNLSEHFDLVIWSETIYYMGDIVSVSEICKIIEIVLNHIAEGGVLVSANIVAQDDTQESRLTKPAMLSAYQAFFESNAEQVHYATYEEWEEESENYYTYEVWGYRQNNS